VRFRCHQYRSTGYQTPAAPGEEVGSERERRRKNKRTGEKESVERLAPKKNPPPLAVQNQL